MFNKKLLTAGAALLVLGAAVAAQPNSSGYITGSGGTASLWKVDPLTCAVTTCTTTPNQASRGFEVGYDGCVYVSAWTINGILKYDVSQTPCVVTTVCADPTNFIAGAPYDPVINNEAIGGPGLWCVDGNPTPATFNAPATRNTFLVDINANTCTVDCWFSNVGPGSVPMSACFNDPLNAAKFIGVGFSTSDLNVTRFDLGTGTPGSCVTQTICTMTEPSQFDAFMNEDCTIWSWNSNSAGNVGFTRIDTVSNQCTTCAVAITHLGAGYAGVWADPPEMPGNLAYVAYADGFVYTVDLANNCAVVRRCQIPGITTASNADSCQENQLSSWLDTAGLRNFHINFGGVPTGTLYALVPSQTRNCTAPPTIVGGLELHFTIDNWTFFALGNVLPYTPTGFLATNGQADVAWNLPQLSNSSIQFKFYWIAAALGTGGIIDISNVIAVNM